MPVACCWPAAFCVVVVVAFAVVVAVLAAEVVVVCLVTVVVITVYRPDPGRWIEFKTRRTKQ